MTRHVDEIVPETAHVVLLRAGSPSTVHGGGADRAALEEVFGGRLAVERSGGYYHVRVDGGP